MSDRAYTANRFEYREVGAPTWILASEDKSAGNGFSTVVVVHNLEDLEPDTSYEARLVALRRFLGLVTLETTPETSRRQGYVPTSIRRCERRVLELDSVGGCWTSMRCLGTRVR